MLLREFISSVFGSDWSAEYEREIVHVILTISKTYAS